MIQQTADESGCFGDAATLDIEGQIRREKPVVQLQPVSQSPIPKLVDIHPAIPQISQLIHEQAVAGGSSQRIHHIQLADGKLLS